MFIEARRDSDKAVDHPCDMLLPVTLASSEANRPVKMVTNIDDFGGITTRLVLGRRLARIARSRRYTVGSGMAAICGNATLPAWPGSTYEPDFENVPPGPMPNLDRRSPPR